MNHEPDATLSAFLDGEPVDSATLAAALTGAGGRETLVDFVLLRGAVAEAVDRPSDAFYRRMEAALAPRTDRRRWRPIAAAAAVLLVAVVGIWSLRPPRIEERDAASAPPVPARSLHFERGVDWQGQG